jgi:probable rRNA maturation factor
MTFAKRDPDARLLRPVPVLGTILNRQRTVSVALPPLRDFLSRVCSELELEQADLTVVLVSDAEIARMNQAFRKKIGPTDVLSFPEGHRRKPRRLPRLRRERAARGGKVSKRREYLGDVLIAPATARRNAKLYGRTLPCELKTLILHGVLHLLGYDHETDRGEMNRVERPLRRRLRLS